MMQQRGEHITSELKLQNNNNKKSTIAFLAFMSFSLSEH
jgi:hypothetical protein